MSLFRSLLPKLFPSRAFAIDAPSNRRLQATRMKPRAPEPGR